MAEPAHPIGVIPPIRPSASSSSSPSSSSCTSPPPSDPASFRLELSCPECGGPVSLGEDDLTTTCAYCESLLLVELEGQEPCYHLPGRLRGREELREFLAEHAAAQKRPDIASAYRDPETGRSLVPPSVIEAQVRQYKERYLETLEIHRVELIHAPYRMALGELAQGLVGRRADGIKSSSFRVFALEATLAGYEQELVNLRDKGLKIAVNGLKLLTREAAAALGGRFLKPADGLEPPVKRAHNLLRPAQDKTLTAVAPPRGEVLFLRQSIVYKPFLWVDQTVAGRRELLLVDAATGTVAGHPSSDEWTRLADSDALGAPHGTEQELVVRAMPSECPVCGHEIHLDRRARLQLCSVCTRALEIKGEGIHVRSYAFGEPERPGGELVYVPFWRFRFGLTSADGRRFDSLRSWLEGIRALPPVQTGAAEHVYLPALRCLGHARLDEAWASLAARASHLPATRLCEGPMPPDAAPGRWLPATLSEAEARQVAPLALYILLDKGRRARVNRPEAQTFLAEARLELSEPLLVLLPWPVSDQAVQLGRLEGRNLAVMMGYLEQDAAALNLRERICLSL